MSMKPITSTIATGSFMPDSPSSTRAARRLMLDPRRIEKTAAPSVAQTIEPSSRPSSVLRSSSQVATRPTITAVSSVPSDASVTLGQTTGLISLQPQAKPPSNRIIASAMMPIVGARRPSSNSIQPSPSDPISIPRARNSSRPGTRRRPATSDAAIPSVRRAPATRMRVPSFKGESLWTGDVGQRPEIAPLVVGPCRSRPRLALAVDPCGAHAELLRGRDVVLEAERDVDDPLRRLADLRERALERLASRLVGADVLGDRHAVEVDAEVAQGVGHDRAVGVRHDPEPQAGVPGGAQGPDGVGERLPALHRAHERRAVAVLPAVAALAAPVAQAVGQDLAVRAVRA